METGLEYRIAQVERKAERHDKDLYHGNGKPALTVRMNDVENDVRDLKTIRDEERKSQRTTQREIRIGVALLIIGQIVAYFVKH